MYQILEHQHKNCTLYFSPETEILIKVPLSICFCVLWEWKLLFTVELHFVQATDVSSFCQNII